MTAPATQVHATFEEVLDDLEARREAFGDDARFSYAFWVDTNRLQDMPSHRQRLIDVDVAAEMSGCQFTSLDEETRDGRCRSTGINIVGSLAELSWFYHLLIAFRNRAARR
jgi:hypothetical protein